MMGWFGTMGAGSIGGVLVWTLILVIGGFVFGLGFWLSKQLLEKRK